MSDSACLAVVRGSSTVHQELSVDWSGDAESTFLLMCSSYNLSKWLSQHERQFQRVLGRSYRPCFVYLAKAIAFNSSFCMYKVGISHSPDYRMKSHDRTPALCWSKPLVEPCCSSGTARLAETAMLVAAARAGWWIGGEWIAGCEASRDSLAIGSTVIHQDKRFRVRASRNASTAH